MSKQDEILSSLQQAIENNWPMRPIRINKFINIEHQEDIALTDRSHILEDVSDLEFFPSGVTAFCVASPLVEDFVCIDLDFENDKELEKEIFEVVLAGFKKEELFLRIGNPKKPGQIWFRCFDELEYYSDIALDVFTTQKRCDALGQYKDTDLTYEWPYKKFWEHEPSDLPVIRKDQVEEVIEKVRAKYGSRKKEKGIGGRHDQLLEEARKFITPQTTPDRAMLHLMETDAYKDLVANPRKGGESPYKEALRIITRVIKDKMDGQFYMPMIEEDSELQENPIMKFAEPTHPKVESQSFMDMTYKLIRRNQRVDNPIAAMGTTINLCSWLASLFARYEGLAPNLMILYVAESGGGKSSTIKIIKQLLKHIPELRNSFRSSNIGSTATLARFISEAPICNLNIDEFSKVMKNKNKEYLGDLPEAICQWYSDFDDYGVPEALQSLKSETNGLAMGAKLVALMSTTPTVFKNFDESLFEQGMGRRLFPMIDNSFSPLKRDFEFKKEYFLDFEIQVIKKVVENYIFNKDGEIFDTMDIFKYKFVKKIEKGETEFHGSCKKSRITLELRSCPELDEYLKKEFIDEINEMRKAARFFGSSISNYLANSAIEFCKKLAALHALFGRSMDKNMLIRPNVEVTMKDFEWGKKMFGHYVIHEAMETYNEIFNKKQEIKAKNDMSQEFLKYLQEKKITSFTKSTKQVHNFFKDKKNSKMAKSIAINSLIESKKVALISGKTPDARGATFELLE